MNFTELNDKEVREYRLTLAGKKYKITPITPAVEDKFIPLIDESSTNFLNIFEKFSIAEVLSLILIPETEKWWTPEVAERTQKDMNIMENLSELDYDDVLFKVLNYFFARNKLWTLMRLSSPVKKDAEKEGKPF